MPTTWLEALKAWNATKGGKYSIPKKDTPEYNTIREMMGEGLKGGGAKPEPTTQNKKVLPRWIKSKKEEPLPTQK